MGEGSIIKYIMHMNTIMIQIIHFKDVFHESNDTACE